MRPSGPKPATPCRTVTPLQVPVVLIVFNRPDTTLRVLDAIRVVRPYHLLVVADGPRAGFPGDEARCEATRERIETVDWECRVDRSFSDSNLGCRARVISGLDWAFSMVEEAIILEDDCVPHATFFGYASELLARYRDDERVMTISGQQPLGEMAERSDSYSFSRYPLIWGWATWRRAWQRNDPLLDRWHALAETDWLPRLLDDPWAARFWALQFQRAYDGFDTWDYGWIFSTWLHRGLAVHPRVNLVANIGFGADATHTREPAPPWARRRAASLASPLRHPPEVGRDPAYDARLEDALYGGTLARLMIEARARIHGRDPRPVPR